MALEPQNIEQRRAMFAEREREWARGGDVMLGIFVAGRVAGSCGLHRRRGPRTLEIGYWIHVSFTRRGLATAVARILTDAAFTVRGIDHVEIHHDRANEASSGIPAGLGFAKVAERADEVEAAGESGVEVIWQMTAAAYPTSVAAAVVDRARRGQPRR